MLELAILGLLKEQPLHGYELKRRVADELAVLGSVSFGSLYPALRRLEKTGAIAMVEPEYSGPPIPSTGSLAGEAAAAMRRLRASGGRRKKAYRISPAGEQLFDELLAAEATGGADDEKAFALRLVFARYLRPAARRALLERRRVELTERLRAAKKSGGHALDAASPAIDRYARSLVEHRVRVIELDLTWIDELIAAESAVSEGEASA